MPFFRKNSPQTITVGRGINLETQCSLCLYDTGHPFGLSLDDKGVCGGCRTHREKAELNWDSRFQLLGEIVSSSTRSSSGYDCAILLQGTPEHFFALNVLQEKLELRVLGVVFNNLFNSQVGIRNLARLRERFNLDCVQFSPNPHKYKKLVRESIAQLGSVRWPALAGERAYLLDVAKRFGIELIFFLNHQATEQVGAFSYTEEVEMTRHSWQSYDLMSVDLNGLEKTSALIEEGRYSNFNYLPDEELKATNIRGVYLSNYIPWDTRVFSESSIENFGALAGKQPRTFDPFDRPNDLTYMAFHDLLKQAKFGYGRVRDSLCQEIRFGRISKSDAQEVERAYLSQVPQREIEMFADWLGTNASGLYWILEKKYQASSIVSPSLEKPVSSPRQQRFVDDFSAWVKNSNNLDEEFVTIGKGLELEEIF